MTIGQTRHDHIDARISDLFFRAISKFPRELQKPAQDFLVEHRAAYICVQELHQQAADLLNRSEASALVKEEVL